jgi:hypothetical protein
MPFVLTLQAEIPVEVPKKPRQMEVKGILSSIPVPQKISEWKGSRAVSDPFLPGSTQYRIPLKQNQSILAEIKSNRPTFRVRIVEATGTATIYDELPQKTDLRKNRALFLNRQRKEQEVLVQIRTTEIVSNEPYTLVLTEIDTDSYLKDLEAVQNSAPNPDPTPTNPAH